MLEQVFLAHFEPMVTRYGPWNCPSGRLDTRTSGHLVEPEGSLACAWRGPTHVPLEPSIEH